jgi:nucleotide-binding universal stress UspA family protein
MARYNRIFAALDGDSTQEAVTRRTLSIAHDNHADVLFGHVIESRPYEASGIDFTALIDEAQQKIEEALDPFLTRARNDECIPSIDVQVKVGHVTDVIMGALVEPFEPDLIVCGVRGLSKIKYALIGSVSTHIVHNADCDVLVVHPEAIEDPDWI